jgi:hypothetical protein
LRLISRRLCALCYSNEIAGGALRRYIDEYTCRFAFNRLQFNRLVARVDWQHVCEKQNRRLRYIGRFLQAHEIVAPLSWDQLEALMPALPRTQRYVPKLVRMALLDIGHIAAERGEIETYAEYVMRRASRAPIARAPPDIRPTLIAFAEWATARQAKPSALATRLRALAAFWQWSSARSIIRPMQVSREHIRLYLAGLYCQWRCRRCGQTTGCSNEQEPSPRRCRHCHHATCVDRIARYRPHTVRQHRASLFVFFEWARLARRALTNPVTEKVTSPAPTIQHYPIEVLRQIGQFIATRDSDPTAALMLYFILFHLVTVRELRHLRLPDVTSLTTRKSLTLLSIDTVLVLPKRVASLGIRHPGRAGGVVRFHRGAEPWLGTLLERFGRERSRIVGGAGKSRYLFVSPRGALRDLPVGTVWIWQSVRASTQAATGIACNANTLRKTASIYMADRVGAGVLSRLGLDAQQAFAYTWVTRELLQNSEGGVR